MDDDYLISAGNRNVQLTWMDAKVEGIPVTPRSGKAVEINSMWYNAIRILEEYAIENGEKEYAKELNNISNIVKESFEKTFLNGKKGLKDTETSEKVRERVIKARKIQKKRYNSDLLNAKMNRRQISRYCKINEDTKKIFEKAIDELQLSVRMYDKVLKVSRTIADLDNSENIETVHLLEALNYRKKY